jgi:hypothetical protein
VVHARAKGHFDGFQIRVPAPAPFGEDACQQSVHFPRALRLDGLRCFFSLA